MSDANNIFWSKFFSTILSFVENNKLQDSSYFIKEQITILQDLLALRKKDFYLPEIELDKIIQSSIQFKDYIYSIKDDLKSDYKMFIPILYYELYIKVLEQAVSLIQKNDIKGLKILLKNCINMEKDYMK